MRCRPPGYSDISAALGRPGVARKADDRWFEVRSIVRRPLACFRELQLEGYIAFGAIDVFHQCDYIERPFSLLGPIASAFVLPCMVQPKLTDGAAGEVADPWKG